ncbi:putative linocin/CFP29 family protein [Methanolinea mesophila]|uniref:family 1 encapsulin nanocompartment shell protein n=1 Tax=Methanolinea mesophila TaxID=547055 RepID=UPI001AE2DF93|nr:family 1 encapsulin nanocompartment shell protein [Methanolinea mesophila]MBP1928653.1 putative linocin/CFP29 family protein [Methanolinea mesophila]
MASKYLAREEAPIGGETWKMLDATMAGAAKSILTGRKLLHIEGPYGLGLKGIPLEDCQVSECMITSQFVPVTMLYTTFCLGIRDLMAYEQTGLPFTASPVAAAALECAGQEDALVFEGVEGCPGLMSVEGANSHKLASWNTVGKAADDIIQALTKLDEAGFHGPYSLALAPSRYNLLYRAFIQGTGTELENLKSIVSAGVYKAPSLKSGGVLIASGKMYASIVLGQDMTIGYIGPVGDSLEFSITESLALLIREPGAICVLKDRE